MTTDTSRSAVEATAKELRERGTEINPVNVADMLDALLVRAENAEAERDDARVGEKFWREHCDEVCENSRDGNAALTEIDECWLATGMMTNRALLSLSEQISALQCEHESDLTAARATIAMEINRRELAEEDLEAAHMVFDDYKAPRTDDGGTLSIAGRLRATIARLTRERDDAVKAEREACANVYDNFFDWVGKQISEAAYQAEEHKKGEAAWATLANSMFDGTLASYRDAIRARTNTKEPTT